jgi:hypothetical protein
VRGQPDEGGGEPRDGPQDDGVEDGGARDPGPAPAWQPRGRPLERQRSGRRVATGSLPAPSRSEFMTGIRNAPDRLRSSRSTPASRSAVIATSRSTPASRSAVVATSRSTPASRSAVIATPRSTPASRSAVIAIPRPPASATPSLCSPVEWKRLGACRRKISSSPSPSPCLVPVFRPELRERTGNTGSGSGSGSWFVLFSDRLLAGHSLLSGSAAEASLGQTKARRAAWPSGVPRRPLRHRHRRRARFGSERALSRPGRAPRAARRARPRPRRRALHPPRRPPRRPLRRRPWRSARSRRAPRAPSPCRSWDPRSPAASPERRARRPCPHRRSRRPGGTAR